MRRLRILALSVVIALVSSTAMAQGYFAPNAQPKCNERDNVLGLLAKKYQETPIAAGVTNTGGLVEVLTSKSGTWTIIISTPQGMSCLVAAGEGWRTMEQIKDEPEA